MARKIIIIGTAHRELVSKAFEGLKNCEKWSMNNAFISYPQIKFDRWFELHSFDRRGRRYIRRGAQNYSNFNTILEYMKAINELNIPVYMQKKWKIIKKSTEFPFEEIMRTFKTKYFGCSFAWMIGFALLEHLKGKEVSEIILVGVDFGAQEYYFQRPSTEYFIGIAQGMGIEIRIHQTSNVCRGPFIYAYKENFDLIDINYSGLVKDLVTITAIPLQDYFAQIYHGEGYDETTL